MIALATINPYARIDPSPTPRVSLPAFNFMEPDIGAKAREAAAHIARRLQGHPAQPRQRPVTEITQPETRITRRRKSIAPKRGRDHYRLVIDEIDQVTLGMGRKG